MLLDARGEVAQFFPLGQREGLPVALLAQVPQPLVVERLVLGRGEEAAGRLGVIHAVPGADHRALGLRFPFLDRVHRPRQRFPVRQPLAILPAHGLVVGGTKILVE